MGRRGVRWGAAFLLAVAGLVALALSGGSDPDPAEPEQAAAPEERPPNIVVVMTDDQGLETVADGTPRSVRSVGRAGTDFEQAIVTTPLCCPARAAFVSGQYGHNNGVLKNDPGYQNLRQRDSVLPSWLAAAGYRTAMIGKFMNGYDRTARGKALRPAPGWEEWVESRRPYSYYDYALNEGGELVRYGGEREEYLTDVFTRKALRSVARLRDDRRPLFLWLPYWAPHRESEDRSDGPCSGSAIPPDRRPASLGSREHPGKAGFERDVSDKPLQIELLEPLDAKGRREARTSFRCSVGALREVDRGVRALRERLRRIGELDRTVFVFTSDNGLFFGQHRLRSGKGIPYEEAIRVPLVIDLPAGFGEQPRVSEAPVAITDLAPTLLELAGARPCAGPDRCRELDGRSLVPLLRGDRPEAFEDRPLLIEAGKGHPCPYTAVREPGTLYAKYPKRQLPLCRELERELYDLDADPQQLENLIVPPTTTELPDRARELEELLGWLEDCSGSGEGDGACP